MILALLGCVGSVTQTGASAPSARTDVVRVVSDFAGCMAKPIDSVVEWVPDGTGYRWEGRWVSTDVVLRARAAILGSNRDAHDLIDQLGITPASIEPRVSELRAFLEECKEAEFSDPNAAAPGLEDLVRFENLSQHIEDWVHRKNWSTTHRGLEISLPGEPPITIVHDGSGMGWCLPWEIDIGDRIWMSSDIRISKAVMPLVPESTPNHGYLDGTSYWDEWVWKDGFFGWELWDNRCAADWASRHRTIEGFDALPATVVVESVRAGSLSVIADLSLSISGVVDRARWWNTVRESKPIYTWNDFLAELDEAMDVVGRNPWLDSWLRDGSDRHVRLMAHGRGGFLALDRVAPEASKAWADSGFRGRPSVELRLERGQDVAATVYLSSVDAGSVVTDARSGAGNHWLDALDVSFHPRAPTYVRIDASGGWELRTGEQALPQPRNRGCRPK